MDAKVIDKIKKLLALAERGGTEDEAATAAEMAAAIALKHGIDLKAVQGASATPRGFLDQAVFTGDKYEVWVSNIVGGICKLNGLKHYWQQEQDSVSYMVIGRPEMIEATKLMTEYLIEATKRLNRQAVAGKKLDKTGRKDFRTAFRLACSQRLRARLYARWTDLTGDDNAAVKATGSTSLVVLDFYEQERRELQTWMEDQGYKFKDTTRNVNVRSRDGYEAGLKAGEQIGIDPQVKGPTKPSHLLK